MDYVGMSLPSPFEILELLQMFVSLLGRHLKARFLWRTSLKEEILGGPSRCSVCLEEEESVDHFFVHCRWVSSLWDFSRSLMGVSWVQTF